MPRHPQEYTIKIKKGRRKISQYLSMSNTFAQFCRGNVDEMYIMEQLADANDRLYLAFHNGAVKGFLLTEGKCFIDIVCAAADTKGAGYKLITSFMNHAKKDGCKTVELMPTTNAIPTWKRYGFTFLKDRPRTMSKDL